MKLKEFSKAFRKLINMFDPIANSKLTKENTPMKMLADWGRKACDLMDDSHPLTPESREKIVHKGIIALSQDMQFKLDKNKHKDCLVMKLGDKERCWEHCSPFWLQTRILEEAGELDESIEMSDNTDIETLRKIQLECADVANFAMMIHDNTNTLIVKLKELGGE